jgi:hypothetical protein
MSNPFNESDRQFLMAVGIDPETTLDDARLAETESVTAGDCGEPNYTTLSGFPICSECGKSTRNMNQLVCAPCRSRTGLLLTKSDRRLLRKMGIAQ